ncbi:MAG: 50S ribosomal protein L4 [Thermodesulfovibrionales bacterium]|nr:50S ribosomal protein L4 [Thermodesulfovibrionales bacterium]
MLEIDIRDINNNVKGKVALRQDIFNNQSDPSIVHSAVVAYLANQRQGNHATKTRALVSGGGKKPWRQKHTGRARHGSIRSPLWRGGGIVFGPQPRDYSIKLPKKIKKNAFYKALTMKLNDSQIIVVDEIKIDKPKTKDAVKIIDNLGLKERSVLVVTKEVDKNLLLSFRNIPNVDITFVNELNTYQLAVYDYIVFTSDALEEIQKEQGGDDK